ncbi:hypothetical protein [Gayadomonas joobiniege]|uniref:hypothetical protein n=1 Tax=Gayadomonas joobiniege TaxID=1234606 RepID=UPI00037C8F73|nr:hypothetical protein [Gayadomonas joobiniege]
MNKQNIIKVILIILLLAIIVYLYQTNNIQNKQLAHTDKSLPLQTKKLTKEPAADSNTDTQPATQNTIAATKSQIFLQQLANSQNDNQLLKTLQELLADDEHAALQALKNLNYLQFSGRRVARLLAEHYAQYPDIFDTIERLKLFMNSDAHFIYEDVAAGLLSQHASHLGATSLIDFISQTEHSTIALKATPAVGRQMTLNSNDPAWVIDSIISTENLPNKESLLFGALDQWLQKDPEALLDYINIQAYRPAYDRVLNKYVHQYKDQNPQKVLNWAAKITNPESRHMAIYAAAQALARKSPEDYKVWINRFDEPDLKSRIQESVGKLKTN